MLEEHYLRWLLSLRLSFILHYFVVFGELDFIRFDHLCDLRFLRFFKTRQHLNQIYGDSEDILGCCDDLLIFFCIIFELFVKIDFSPIEGVLMFL
jgi:hypothetical protein